MNHIRLLLFLILTVFCVQRVLSQSADHINGGRFEKRVEYSTSSSIRVEDGNGNILPYYDVSGKTPLDKIFFGLTNNPIECVIATSFEGTAGLRFYKVGYGGNTTWMVEVIPFGDYEMAVRAVKRETEQIEIPNWFLGRLQQDYQDQVREHNKTAPIAARTKETYTSRRPETMTFPLYHLGDRLYEKMVALIDNFRAEGGYAVIADGYTSTFRCVVGDELWTLTIHIPQRRALQMSNLCRQMIEDARDGSFDEWKYVRMLEPIEF